MTCKKLRRYIFVILCILFLTGCADIRNRASPDALAVSGNLLAVHISGQDGTVTAKCDPLQFPDAVSAAAGAKISAGHISVLMLSEDPARILPAYLQNGWIAPTAQVISAADAVALLNSDPPSAEDIRAAADTGQIPPRTADTVLGDLLGGSGVTALTAPAENGFRLDLWDDAGFCGTLPESACRGLALLCGRYCTFTAADADCCFTVDHAKPEIHAEMYGNILQISVSGTFRCGMRRGSLSDAERLLSTMLTAALSESVTKHGADLLQLRERAGAGRYSRTAWRSVLQSAAFSTDITVTAGG